MYSQILEVPEEYIGLIIGKKGKTIKKIRDLFMVDIRLKDKKFHISSENSLTNLKLSINYIKEIYRKKASEDLTCPICLSMFEEKDIIITECGHKFHHSCLKESLKRGNKCPICRSQLDRTPKKMTHSQIERIVNETIRHSINDGTFYMMVYYMSTDSYIHCNSVSIIREMVKLPLRYALHLSNNI